jgi:hypothetical protein
MGKNRVEILLRGEGWGPGEAGKGLWTKKGDFFFRKMKKGNLINSTKCTSLWQRKCKQKVSVPC